MEPKYTVLAITKSLPYRFSLARHCSDEYKVGDLKPRGEDVLTNGTRKRTTSTKLRATDTHNTTIRRHPFLTINAASIRAVTPTTCSVYVAITAKITEEQRLKHTKYGYFE